MPETTLSFDGCRLQRILYADVLVPPEITGLSVDQVQEVAWREPQWAERDQVRASASAWIVDAGELRVVLDPMFAADHVLHDPESEQLHQRAIADTFARADVPRETVDLVVASHIEGIGMIGERSADGAWTRFFPNARVCVSEEVLAEFEGDVPENFTADAWRELFAEDVVETFADGAEIVPGMRADVSGGHNPGHTVFHFGDGPDATFVGHLAVSPLHLATGLCPQQHREPERAWKLLHEYADDGRILIGPLWPTPGCGRWSGERFAAAL